MEYLLHSVPLDNLDSLMVNWTPTIFTYKYLFTIIEQ